MSETKINVHSIDEPEERRMLDAYMASGTRQMDEAMATAPDTYASQSDWNRFARGDADVLKLPEHATAGSNPQGEPGTPHAAEVIPIRRVK